MHKYKAFAITFVNKSGEVITKLGVYGNDQAWKIDDSLDIDTRGFRTDDEAETAEESIHSTTSGDDTENNHLYFTELIPGGAGGDFIKDFKGKIDEEESPYYAQRGAFEATAEDVQEMAAVTRESSTGEDMWGE